MRRNRPDPSGSVTEPARNLRLLHVLNGDSVLGTLERSGVFGTFAVWADVLHEGPVPPASGTMGWRETRARFIASSGIASYEDALGRYEQWDADLQRFRDFDEIVLWFEHDLFDQLLLVRHLDWLSRQPRGQAAVSLICAARSPAFPTSPGSGNFRPRSSPRCSARASALPRHSCGWVARPGRR